MLEVCFFSEKRIEKLRLLLLQVQGLVARGFRVQGLGTSKLLSSQDACLCTARTFECFPMMAANPKYAKSAHGRTDATADVPALDSMSTGKLGRMLHRSELPKP